MCGERNIPKVVGHTRDRRATDCDRGQRGVICLWASGATYIQSPNRKLVFGFGGLLDRTNGLDLWGIGATRSWSGENLEG